MSPPERSSWQLEAACCSPWSCTSSRREQRVLLLLNTPRQHSRARHSCSPFLCSPFCRTDWRALTFGVQQKGLLEGSVMGHSHQVPATGLSRQARQWEEALAQGLPKSVRAHAWLPTPLLPLCSARDGPVLELAPSLPSPQVLHCDSCAVYRRRFCFLFFCNTSSARFKFNFLLFNKHFFGSAFFALQLF